MIARLVKEMYENDLNSIQPREDVFHAHNIAIQQQLSDSASHSHDLVSDYIDHGEHQMYKLVEDHGRSHLGAQLVFCYWLVACHPYNPMG